MSVVLLMHSPFASFSFLGIEPVLHRLQSSAATLDHLVEMSHSAHANIDADAKLLSVIFNEMYRECSHTHYATTFEHEEAACQVAQVAVSLLPMHNMSQTCDHSLSELKLVHCYVYATNTSEYNWFKVCFV